MINNILSILRQLGPLRIALTLAALLLSSIAPDAQTQVTLEWPQIVPSLIAPAIIPLVLLVVLLDILMSKIFLSSAEQPEARKKYRQIILIHTVTATVIIVAWFDFFATLGQI